MKIILNYIYGILDALPEERLHHLILAADRLQACDPSSLPLTVTLLWIEANKMLLCVVTHHWAHRKKETCLICLMF